MKLARITKPLRSVQVRITMTGELMASLDDYARYYEHVHGEAVESKALVAQILRAFIDADREYLAWARSHTDSACSYTVPEASNRVTAKAGI
jgi:hypothetical protein